jgi:hypothetical protein
LPHPVSPNWHNAEEIWKKTKTKTNDVPLGETTVGKLLMLLPHTWNRVQANLFPYYFLCKEGIGIVSTTGSFLGYYRKSKLPFVTIRIRVKNQIIFCSCYNTAQNPNYLLPLL